MKLINRKDFQKYWDDIYTAFQGTRKPDNWDEAYSFDFNDIEQYKEVFNGWELHGSQFDIFGAYSIGIQIIKSAFDNLPLIKKNLAFPSDNVPTHDQYFILLNNKNYYFIDTQGFDYCRYVLRLINYK